MGRPRSFDRDVALEIALAQFWRDGFDAVSVASLSSAIGVAAPSLYAAFGDKQALYDEAVALYCRRLDAGLSANLAEPRARDAVTRLLTSSLEHFTADGTPPGCLVMSEPRLLERRRVTRAAVRARLRAAAEDGELGSRAEADALAAFIDTVLTGMAAQARDGATRHELRTAAAVAMRAWPDRAGADPWPTPATDGPAPAAHRSRAD